MGNQRPRFTIRGLMIAIAVVAISLAMALEHWELLPLVIIAGIPVGGLIGLHRKVPSDRPGWKLGVRAAILGWLILGAGWLWGQTFVWWFKQQEKLHGVVSLPSAHHDGMWWLHVPLGTTAFFLIAHTLGLARFCRGRGQAVGCWFAFGYASALAIAYLLMVVSLIVQLDF